MGAFVTKQVLRQWTRERVGAGRYVKQAVPRGYKGEVIRAMMAGNGKMGHRSAELSRTLISIFSPKETRDIDVVLAPGALWLAKAAEVAKQQFNQVALAAQDVSVVNATHGAFTAEISAEQYYAAGARYAIVGHSERRRGKVFGAQIDERGVLKVPGFLPVESDAMVAAKVAAALRGNLIPIICVGETLAERDTGKLEEVIAAQVVTVLAQNPLLFQRGGIWAYEPVWAIGTGKTASPKDANEGCALVRELIFKHGGGLEAALYSRVLYGGSMNPGNVESLMVQPNIDGGLIGGAFMDADKALALVSFGMNNVG